MQAENRSEFKTLSPSHCFYKSTNLRLVWSPHRSPLKLDSIYSSTETVARLQSPWWKIASAAAWEKRGKNNCSTGNWNLIIQVKEIWHQRLFHLVNTQLSGEDGRDCSLSRISQVLTFSHVSVRPGNRRTGVYLSDWLAKDEQKQTMWLTLWNVCTTPEYWSRSGHTDVIV